MPTVSRFTLGGKRYDSVWPWPYLTLRVGVSTPALSTSYWYCYGAACCATFLVYNSSPRTKFPAGACGVPWRIAPRLQSPTWLLLKHLESKALLVVKCFEGLGQTGYCEYRAVGCRVVTQNPSSSPPRCSSLQRLGPPWRIAPWPSSFRQRDMGSTHGSPHQHWGDLGPRILWNHHVLGLLASRALAHSKALRGARNINNPTKGVDLRSRTCTVSRYSCSKRVSSVSFWTHSYAQ